MRALLTSCLLCASSAAMLAQAQPETRCPHDISRINMPSGSYSSQPGVTFSLQHFTARLVPMGHTAPFCYEKITEVQHARIFTSSSSLTNIFSSKLSQTNSKLQDLQIVNGEGTVRLSGIMHELVPIKFMVEGPVSTDGTSIRVDVTSIKADGIPIKLVLATLGKHLNSLFGSLTMPGIAVDGNTMLFRPEALAHLRGHIISAVASPTGLTLTYGPPPKPSPNP